MQCRRLLSFGTGTLKEKYWLGHLDQNDVITQAFATNQHCMVLGTSENLWDTPWLLVWQTCAGFLTLKSEQHVRWIAHTHTQLVVSMGGSALGWELRDQSAKLNCFQAAKSASIGFHKGWMTWQWQVTPILLQPWPPSYWNTGLLVCFAA